MKIKIKDIVEAYTSGSLNKFYSITGLRGSALLAIVKINKALASQIKIIANGHDKLKQEISDEAQLEAEIIKFNEQEIELDIEPVAFQDFENQLHNFSSNDLLHLEFIFNMEVKKGDE